MAIFQVSVINKYLQTQDKNLISNRYAEFQKFYGDSERIENIKLLKEENYQEGFLREIFVDVLGYTINPDKNYNITTEYKNETDSKKADGAILHDGKAIAVIELKSTKTKSMESIQEQAFNYKNNQSSCRYVITSNFNKLRFYIDNATEYEEFNLFTLTLEEFSVLYLLLSSNSILNYIPSKLKDETKFHEENISGQFYKDYSSFKNNIYQNLIKNNTEYNKLVLFKKSQKFLDRLLFVFFAEDTGLVPPNSISSIVEQWQQLHELEADQPLYDRFKLFFAHLNTGHKYKLFNLPAYNGGLFAPDEILDNIIIDDVILNKDSLKLSSYDFNTDIDVNILGHIFEHSLSEIEEITSELEGAQADNKKSKRKKDGIFYTPKYITQYIVDNTVGTLCKEKREELGIENIDIDLSYRNADGKISQKGKVLYKKFEDYKTWLLTLKILDPACGSGAFLNQALSFLIKEHSNIDELMSELLNQPIYLPDNDTAILENNIFGVDINEESVEIAKLSLWLRTAKKGRKLSTLSSNIKCGNSLIDDPEVAGDKAFDWNKEFSEIMTNGGFDVVIGNPPYVRADSLGNLIPFREHMVRSDLYKTLKGKWDLYIPFIELSIKLLTNNGISSLIIPDAYCHAEYATRSLEYFTENKMLKRIDYYPNIEVFANVGVKSVIVTYIKNKLDCIFKTRTHNADYSFSEKVFKDYPNSFRLDYSKSIIAGITNGINISNIFYISKGIVGNSDEKKYKGEFIVGDLLSIEKDETHPKLYYEGKNINKWFLNEKRWIEFGTERSPKKWSRKGFMEFFTSEKIVVVRSPGREPKAFIDKEQGFFNESAIGFVRWCDLKGVNNKSLSKSYKSKDERELFEKSSATIKIQYLIAVMNSSLIKYELNADRRSNIHIYPDDWRKIKIIQLPIEQQQPFIQKADEMLELNKRHQEKKTIFLNRIQSNLSIAKITKKIDSFYSSDFKTFIAELKKQKVTLSLKDQDEWEEYFNLYKNEINNLQTEIAKTDNEIDQMVYELYGLTEEEIKIVEES
jgi:Eco57I restriction-modification methylase/restriction-modification enzyme MmeI-like protein